MERMSKTGILPNLNIENFDGCESCIKGKMIAKTFTKHWQSSEFRTNPLKYLWTFENQNTQRNGILHHLY